MLYNICYFIQIMLYNICYFIQIMLYNICYFFYWTLLVCMKEYPFAHLNIFLMIFFSLIRSQYFPKISKLNLIFLLNELSKILVKKNIIWYWLSWEMQVRFINVNNIDCVSVFSIENHFRIDLIYIIMKLSVWVQIEIFYIKG